MNLEQSMRDICAAHGLLNIGLTCHHEGHISVDIQWAKGDDKRGCVFGRGETFAEALQDALRQMAEERHTVTLADVPLAVDIAA